MQIILGSQSPRRLEILQKAGFEVEVIVPKTNEQFPSNLSIYQAPEFIATQKLDAISSLIKQDNRFIICADTIVLFEQQLLGKPTDEQQAFAYLKRMNGKKHEVITGVCMRKQQKSISFSERAIVHFKQLSDAEIWHYIQHYNTLDKAGAYNIQEYNGIDMFEGEFENIMGLPIQCVLHEMSVWNSLT